MLLVSCGGGGKSSQQTVSEAGATGRTSPTAPRPSKTNGGTKGKHKTNKRNGQSVGVSRSSPSSPSLSAPSKNARLQKLKRKAAALQKQLNKKKRVGRVPAAPKPAPQPGARPQEVLARKAKRVCESIGIQALARRYKVARTAEAVATAYAASYPPTFRAAVRDGCRSAFPVR
jgi:hypothetical protein